MVGNCVTWANGFLCPADDHDALVRLDGWLVDMIKQAYVKWAHIFKTKGGMLPKLSKKKLITGSWYNSQKYNSVSFSPTATAPSFVRGWAAARKFYYSFGLERVEPPRYIGYY